MIEISKCVDKIRNFITLPQFTLKHVRIGLIAILAGYFTAKYNVQLWTFEWSNIVLPLIVVAQIPDSIKEWK